MKVKISKLMPAIENGKQVWVVVKGMECKYAWPRDGKSSLEVAKEIQANWK